MSEPVDCPYLGLRQNRAIRFAAPTPEHRCYRDGTPVEIPVDQRTYCLTAQHRVCPLYTGQWDASTLRADGHGATGATRRAAVYDTARASAGGAFSGISRRSLAVYFGLIGVVLLCTFFWGIAYYYRAWQGADVSPIAPGAPSPTFALPVVLPPTTVAPSPTPTASATAVPPPTDAPTASTTPTVLPSPSPTTEPTFAIIPTVTIPVAPEPPPPPAPTSEPPTEEATALPLPTDTAEPPTAFPTVEPILTSAPPSATPPTVEPTLTSAPPSATPPTVEPTLTSAPPSATPPTVEPTIPPAPTETTAPPTPQEPTATIVLQLTVLPQQRP